MVGQMMGWEQWSGVSLFTNNTTTVCVRFVLLISAGLSSGDLVQWIASAQPK